MKRKRVQEQNGNVLGVEWFDSWRELAEHCEQTKTAKDDSCSSFHNGPSKHWDLNCGWENAVEYSKSTWSKGKKELDAATGALEGALASKSYRPKPQNAICGGFVDVPAYLSGQPDCMVHYRKEVISSGGKVVSIISNTSGSCGVPAEKFVRRGAAVYALVDALEQYGYRVEVDIAYGIADNTGRRFDFGYCCVAKIKHAGQQVDPNELAFSLLHPAAFRRIGFRAVEIFCDQTEDHKGRNWGRELHVPNGSYGYPSELPEWWVKEQGYTLEIPTLHLDDSHCWNNDESTFQWLHDTLKERWPEVLDEK